MKLPRITSAQGQSMSLLPLERILFIFRGLEYAILNLHARFFLASLKLRNAKAVRRTNFLLQTFLMEKNR